VISTFAGAGPGGILAGGFSGDGGAATKAKLDFPHGVAADRNGNVYIADTLNNRIRKVDASGIISTVAGNGKQGFSGDGGPASNAALNSPYRITVDAAGNLYIADSGNNRIRRVDTGGIITTIAGSGAVGFSSGGFGGDGQSATSALLSFPVSIALDSAGTIYIADSSNRRVRAVVQGSPSLAASPPALSFSATGGGVTPPLQKIDLTSSVAGLTFTASASASWLSVTPVGGSIPTTLQVNVDPTQLAPGIFSGSVTIAATGVTQTVNVSFNVAAAPGGKLGVSSPSVAFSVTQGSAGTSAQLSVSNQGGGSIAFTATASTSTGGSWLQVSAASGTATPANAVSLQLRRRREVSALGPTAGASS
jgi:BACON domain-containing protein/NHL repeat-containing protein